MSAVGRMTDDRVHDRASLRFSRANLVSVDHNTWDPAYDDE